MKKPVLLDLFACSGIGGDGYKSAGFDIISVDIEDQPNNPHNFNRMDWLEGLKKFADIADVIHASPPCQGYSRTKSLHSIKYETLVDVVRAELQRIGKPYVMENVQGAPLMNAIWLDGIMFGLKVVRKRLFESNVLLFMPGKGHKKGSVGAKNCTRKDFNGYYIVGGHQMGTLEEWKMAMGVLPGRNVTREELAESIPPAYTEYIGRQLMNFI